MNNSVQRFGLSCALALPVDRDGRPDLPRLAAHAGWCLANGCDSLTVFGTTGEGASLGTAAREKALGALAGARIDLSASVLGGVAASGVEDAVDQMRMLMDAGCRGVLMAPPFYFKGVSDDGLFAWFSRVFEAVGAQARDVILYNIPSVTAVSLSPELVGRLRSAFPGVVTGVKDSSGDWAYTQRLLAAHKDMIILIGDERHLAAGVRLGAQGAISGLANVCPQVLLPLVREGRDDPRIVDLVEVLLTFPVTPAVKALVAHRTGDAAWLAARAPLVGLDAAAAARIGAAYDRLFAARAA